MDLTRYADEIADLLTRAAFTRARRPPMPSAPGSFNDAKHPRWPKGTPRIPGTNIGPGFFMQVPDVLRLLGRASSPQARAQVLSLVPDSWLGRIARESKVRLPRGASRDDAIRRIATEFTPSSRPRRLVAPPRPGTHPADALAQIPDDPDNPEAAPQARFEVLRNLSVDQLREVAEQVGIKLPSPKEGETRVEQRVLATFIARSYERPPKPRAPKKTPTPEGQRQAAEALRDQHGDWSQDPSVLDGMKRDQLRVAAADMGVRPYARERVGEFRERLKRVVEMRQRTGFKPGEWEEIDPGVLREEAIAKVQAALARRGDPKSSQYKQAEKQMMRLVDELYPKQTDGDDLVLRNDGVTVTVRGGTRDVDTTELTGRLERLIADHPEVGPVSAVVIPDRQMRKYEGKDVLGYVLPAASDADIHAMVLSDALWTRAADRSAHGHFMDQSKKHSRAAYVIAHEFGHLATPDPAGDVDKTGMSGYGRTNDHEAAAEAFAEWHLSGGRTSNGAAQRYAQAHGWPGADSDSPSRPARKAAAKRAPEKTAAGDEAPETPPPAKKAPKKAVPEKSTTAGADTSSEALRRRAEERGMEISQRASDADIARALEWEDNPDARPNNRLRSPEWDEVADQAQRYDSKPEERTARIIVEPEDHVTTLTDADLPASWGPGATETMRGTWVEIQEPGGAPGEIYGSDYDAFLDMYERVPGQPGKWRKTAKVDAVQWTGEPKTIRTLDPDTGELETEREIQPGQWLVRQTNGEIQVITDEKFRRLYDVDNPSPSPQPEPTEPTDRAPRMPTPIDRSAPPAQVLEQEEAARQAALAAPPVKLKELPARSADGRVLRYYQRFGDEHMNGLLRQGRVGKPEGARDVPDADTVRASIEQIDGIMARSELTEPITVYRGLSRPPVPGPPGSAVGRTFTDEGFGSASASRRLAFDFAPDEFDDTTSVMLEVRVPAGVRAIGISDEDFKGASPSALSEQEILLERGLQYRIVSDEMRDDVVMWGGEATTARPYRHIVVEAVPPARSSAKATKKTAPAKKTTGRRPPAKRVPPKPAKKAPPAKAPGKRVGGRDVFDDPKVLAELATVDPEQAVSFRVRGSDRTAVALAEHLGFDGLPEVVDSAEFDQLVADGAVREMFRGARTENPAEIHRLYREGPLYLGRGREGVGTYMATERERAEFYSDGSPGSVARYGLRADARTIDSDELERQWEAWFRETFGQPEPPWEVLSRDPRYIAYGDQGRWAMAHGYDAIIVRPNHGHWPRPYEQIVILNRTAVVAEAPTPRAAKSSPNSGGRAGNPRRADGRTEVPAAGDTLPVRLGRRPDADIVGVDTYGLGSRIIAALDAWDGKGRDPLRGLSREQLSAAVEQLELRHKVDTDRASARQLRDVIRNYHASIKGKPRAADAPSFEDAVKRRVDRPAPRPRGAAPAPEPRAALTAAETIAELGAAAAAEAKRITGRDITFDFGESDVQVSREHAEGILRGLEAFPHARLAAVRMAEMQTEFRLPRGHDDDHGEVWAFTRARDDGTFEIAFSRLSSSPEGVRHYRDSLSHTGQVRRMGRGHVGSTPMSVALHEFGHVVDHTEGFGLLGRVARRMADEHLEAIGYRRDAVGTSIERRAADARRRVAFGFIVSRYAMESDKELAAEVFADVMEHGDDASELSRAILDAFEDEREARR